MNRSKRYSKSHLSLLTLGMVYVFLFLFLNASFSPVYNLLLKESSITAFVDLNSDLQKNNSENEAEDTKKISEISKEYFLANEDLLFIQYLEKRGQNFYHLSDLLSHYPEKDSPPPKTTLLKSGLK